MRFLRRALLALAMVAALAVSATFIPRPLFSSRSAHAAGAMSRQILVVSNPIHTDLAFPLDEETLARFPFLEAAGLPVRHPLARWVIFGWGGRSFYLETPTWAELKPLPVLRSLTVDRSVNACRDRRRHRSEKVRRFTACRQARTISRGWLGRSPVHSS